MSHYHYKRHRSRSPSRSSANKRESQQNRSTDYNRRADSFDRHHHSVQSNRQYNHHHLSDLTVSLDEIISHAEEYPPLIQSLVREVLLEQNKRKLIEERLNLCEHNYALLRAQHKQTINNVTVLKHNYDQCRLDLKNSCIQLNELHHRNCQLKTHIDHFLNNERQQMYTNEDMFNAKRQRRY